MWHGAEAVKVDGQPASTIDNAAAAGSSTPDGIDGSSDAQLIAAALAAASDTPAIRQDLVDRAREKLAQGTLGADADALADALLDDALGKT
jgi:flagellar biosynthesis anti-sigma factor FlgM